MVKQISYLDEAAHQALRNAAIKVGRGKTRRFIRSAIPPVKLSCDEANFLSYPKDNYTDFTLWLNGRPREHRSVNTLVELVKGKKLHLLDIGANMGLYTIMIARAAASDSILHAFEPNPVMVARLKENLKLNGLTKSVKIHQIALGSDVGHADLHMTDNLGESSLITPKDIQDSISVPVKTLTEFLPKPKGKHTISVLKIDIEGYEDKALSPLLTAEENTLPDWILAEVVHRNLWSSDIIAALQAKGYNIISQKEGNMLLSHSSVGKL